MKIYSFPAFDVKVHEKNDVQLDVLVKIKNMYPKNITVNFIGAAPGKTNHENVSAKTLPFLNREDAYEHTPNKGTFTLSNKVFCFGMLKPNSYYTDDKQDIVPPYFTITLSNETKTYSYDVVLTSEYEEKEVSVPRSKRYNKTQESLLRSKAN